MKILTMACLLSCLMFLTGCNKDAPSSTRDESNHPHSHTSQSYQKPGANVRLSHNYDGATNVGEIENISLSFTERYSSGEMYIQLKPDKSLMIEPATQDFIFSMEDKNSHTIDLSVSANTKGKYLLNIFASVIDDYGQLRSRVMAIAFYMGDKNHNQSKIQNSDTEETVIILPSQESGAEN
jgi:hypothetical protein